MRDETTLDRVYEVRYSSMPVRVLYVSQNGMAESLGQAQVLPYLRGLSRRGAEIDLVSFELVTLDARVREEIVADLAKDGIRWHALARTMNTPLRVKIAEAAKGAALALGTAMTRHPDIVHGRSYFATAICDAVGTVSRRSKVLFDCRGMLGDEFVDCGHWTKDRLEYRLIKAYERRAFRHSDGIVFLTRALRGWLEDHRALGPRPTVSVIPCCVDMEKFRPSDDARRRVREELGLGDAFTMIYSGSLGTWYLEPEMARIAIAIRGHLAEAHRRAVFLCLTPSDATGLRAALERAGFPAADVIVRKVAPKAMPEHLAAGHVGLSFIQSCFSKKGSSPTKVAEYLATGNVAVLNGDIGDQADLKTEPDACVVLDDFSDAEIDRASRRVIALADRPREVVTAATTAAARRHFDLGTVGVARYSALYEALVAKV